MIVSNQNYAGFGHIAYYWSPDWGDTWISHPDNPIIAPGQFPEGVPPEGFQRTPTLLIDEEYERYILAYNAGHDINEKWKRRTYLAIASRPRNHPPEIPDINGTTGGSAGTEYTYTFNSVDPDGDDVFYYIKWGDGHIESWDGPHDSGVDFDIAHTYAKQGKFTIQAKAKDAYDTESDWAELEVTMPRNKAITSSLFLQFLERFLLLNRLLYLIK